MRSLRVQELERIATSYHLNDQIRDKFIEDICQLHCCDWLESLLGSNDSVIEMGYGEGITLSRLSKKVPRYTVIEGAPSLANTIRMKHPDVEVVESLFEDYRPREKFDKVLALHVLEHVDDAVALSRHLREWLKPEGDLVVVLPNKESLHRRLAVLMGLAPTLDTLSERDHLVGHQRVYDLVSLQKDLATAGFESVETKGFFLKVLPNSMMLTYSPELIKALNVLSEQFPAEMAANIAVRAKLVKRY